MSHSTVTLTCPTCDAEFEVSCILATDYRGRYVDVEDVPEECEACGHPLDAELVQENASDAFLEREHDGPLDAISTWGLDSAP